MPLLHEPPPLDRRTSRTHRALRDALFALTQCEDYEAITVDALCERADVGRSTFYAHFRGKDDLKRSWVRTLDVQPGSAPSSAVPFSFSLPVLRHARDHLRHIRHMGVGRGREVALEALREWVQQHVRLELDSRVEASAEERELAARFFTGAFMAVLTGWLAAGAHQPPEAVDAAFRRLATGGAVGA